MGVIIIFQHLPNIIFDISKLNYDELNNSTNITGFTWFENSSIEQNLNIGNNLNVTNILSQKINSDVIVARDS